jgi:hypothetical protein
LDVNQSQELRQDVLLALRCGISGLAASRGCAPPPTRSLHPIPAPMPTDSGDRPERAPPLLLPYRQPE